MTTPRKIPNRPAVQTKCRSRVAPRAKAKNGIITGAPWPRKLRSSGSRFPRSTPNAQRQDRSEHRLPREGREASHSKGNHSEEWTRTRGPSLSMRPHSSALPYLRINAMYRPPFVSLIAATIARVERPANQPDVTGCVPRKFPRTSPQSTPSATFVAIRAPPRFTITGREWIGYGRTQAHIEDGQHRERPRE